MRRVPVTEIGLIEIPASLWPRACRRAASIQAISSAASGEPSSNSIPA